MGKQMNEQTAYMRAVGFDLRQAYDANGRPQYVGLAYPGAADSDAKWQIYKLAYDANGRLTHRRYADKTDDYTKVWNDRANYNYVDI